MWFAKLYVMCLSLIFCVGHPHCMSHYVTRTLDNTSTCKTHWSILERGRPVLHRIKEKLHLGMDNWTQSLRCWKDFKPSSRANKGVIDLRLKRAIMHYMRGVKQTRSHEQTSATRKPKTTIYYDQFLPSTHVASSSVAIRRASLSLAWPHVG